MSVCARLRGREVSMDEVLAVHSQDYAKLMTTIIEAKDPDKVLQPIPFRPILFSQSNVLLTHSQSLCALFAQVAHLETFHA